MKKLVLGITFTLFLGAFSVAVLANVDNPPKEKAKTETKSDAKTEKKECTNTDKKDCCKDKSSTSGSSCCKSKTTETSTAK